MPYSCRVMPIPQPRVLQVTTEVRRPILVLWMIYSVMKHRMEMSLLNSFPIVVQVKVEEMFHVFVVLCVAMNMIPAAAAEAAALSAVGSWMQKRIEKVSDKGSWVFRSVGKK